MGVGDGGRVQVLFSLYLLRIGEVLYGMAPGNVLCIDFAALV